MSRRPPIRGLLFDKDGTLLDYRRTWVPINRELATLAAGGDAELRDAILRAGGHDPDTDIVAPGSIFAAAGLAEITATMAEVLGPRAPGDLSRLVEATFRDGGQRHSVLIDGVAAALVHYSRLGFRLGIATNDTEAGIASSLGRHGVLEMFEFGAGCDSGHGVKPEPGMVHAFADAIGVSVAEVAVIGDSIHDLATARSAGAGLAIGVLSGTSGRDDLAELADAIIDSVGDVPALLRVLQPG